MRLCGNFLDYCWEGSLAVPLLAAHAAAHGFPALPLAMLALTSSVQRGAERWPQHKAQQGPDHGDLCGGIGTERMAAPSAHPNQTLCR